MGAVSGNPELLEGYTRATETTIAPAETARSEASSAISTYNGASPNDLGTSVGDVAGPVGDVLAELATFDQRPAALAEALRALDRDGGIDGVYEVDAAGLVTAMIAERLEDPSATTTEIRARAAAQEITRLSAEEPSSENYAALRQVMEEVERGTYTPGFAGAFFDELGQDGLEDFSALAGGYRETIAEPDGTLHVDALNELVRPMARLFAVASSAGEVETIEQGLLDSDSTEGRITTAMLLTDGYADPEWTALAAEKILRPGDAMDNYNLLLGLGLDHEAFVTAEEHALKALARQPEAAWHFAVRGDNVEVLLRPADHLEFYSDERGVNADAAAVLEAGLAAYPRYDPDPAHEAATNAAIARMIGSVGDDGVPDELKIASARVVVTVYDHLATSLHGDTYQGPGIPPGLEGVGREEADDFFAELAYSDGAIQIATDGAAVFLQYEIGRGLAAGGDPLDVTNTEAVRAGMIFGAIGAGMAEAGLDEEKRRAAVKSALDKAAGLVPTDFGPWKVVTGPTLDAGKDIGIDFVIDATGRDVVDAGAWSSAIDGPIAESIAKALYSHERAAHDGSTPFPSYEEWRADDEVDDLVAEMRQEVRQEIIDRQFTEFAFPDD